MATRAPPAFASAMRSEGKRSISPITKALERTVFLVFLHFLPGLNLVGVPKGHPRAPIGHKRADQTAARPD
jgi:hypothetical protein